MPCGTISNINVIVVPKGEENKWDRKISEATMTKFSPNLVKNYKYIYPRGSTNPEQDKYRESPPKDISPTTGRQREELESSITKDMQGQRSEARANVSLQTRAARRC